jgi:hypothetical protein
LLSWLSSFTVNPLLLAGGAALIASPILIHLLSRRRFRTVHWAAMDFLVTADKKNRRRVQLENLLLMLLRCLIILLIAFLVARPFLSSSALTAFGKSNAGIERIVILDDSPSMAVDEAFEKSRERLIQFVEGLSNDRPQDRFTLYLTSAPDEPYGRLNSRELFSDNMTKLVVSDLSALSVSTQVANLQEACQAVNDSFANDPDKNRVVYLVSDMRERDWTPTADGEDSADELTESIQTLAETASGVYVVDVGNNELASNLSVVSIAPTDPTLVAGVGTKIRATILNTGPNSASKVAVRLVVNDTVTRKMTIPSIPVGKTRSVEFPHNFLDGGPVRVRVEIDSDAMHADDEHFFAAQVRKATEVLLVQEDTVYDDHRDEPTFTLARLLDPRGYRRSKAKPGDDFASGFAVSETTESQLDGLDLEKFDVIFLCNLPSLTKPQTKQLEDWVRDGGGLFVALGDSINKQIYNERLYKDGEGLLPVKLLDMVGSTDHEQWEHIEATKPTHPAVDVFAGDTAIAARFIKFFQWWSTEAKPEDIVANLNGLEKSPLLVEKAFGKGRVMVWTSTISDAWNDLPLDANYATVVARSTEHIRRNRTQLTTQDVGQPIQYDFDATRYRTGVRLTTPSGDNAQVDVQKIEPVGADNDSDREAAETPDNPQPSASTSTTSTQTPDEKAKDGAEETEIEALEDDTSSGTGDTLATDMARIPHRAIFTDTGDRGFYELKLKGFNNEVESILFARNIDVSEGQLKRVDSKLITEKLDGNDRIHFIQESGDLSLDASGTRQSYWRQILIALLVVLAVEQSLAWYFGTRR